MRRNHFSHAAFVLFVAATFFACNALKPMKERLVSPDEKTREKAIKKLAGLPTDEKEKLVTPLLADFKNPESRVVNRAMEALVAIGAPATEGLRGTLKDPDVFVRLTAVAALGRLGPTAKNTLPDLLLCLNDSHPLVREETAFALGNIGQAASSEAAPALLKTLRDTNEDVRATATDALKKLGVQPPPLLPKKVG